HGLRTDPQGGGDVRIVASDNATTLQLFELGQLDGAWVPEPWASRLVDEGHGTVLVDEASLWPGGRFPTTELVVATDLLDRHPDAVRRLVAGNVAAVDWLNAQPDEARTAVNEGLRRLTQSALSAPVLAGAWSHLTFTVDPLPALLPRHHRPPRDRRHRPARQRPRRAGAGAGVRRGARRMRVLAPTAALSPAFTALPGPPAIRLDAVSRVFGSGPRAVAALDRVSLEVGRGEFVCVVGASGCGKSTLLALVAGLDRPTEGRVEVEGGRPALMFQDAGLLPWLSVARNVDLPLRLRRVPRAERVDEVERLLRLVHLDAVADRRPHQLSGGMRQRVALARALAQHSEVLLMDEP
ncbi:MAG: ATP-binding cassette domain-containing protein, partial [Chloroflexi bacterium]